MIYRPGPKQGSLNGSRPVDTVVFIPLMTVQSRDKENDFIFAILDVVIGRLRVDVDGYER